MQRIRGQVIEAKRLYIAGNMAISEEDYRNIDPFDEDERWSKFDGLGKIIMAEGSELYSTHQRVCEWVKANAAEFS